MTEVLSLNYLRQTPLPRIKELVRGAASTTRHVNWHDVAVALIERIEDAKGYPRILYEDEW